MPEPAHLFEYVDVARRRWRFLGACMFGAGVITLILALLQPRWYESDGRVLPPHEERTPLFSLRGLEAAVRLETLLPFAAGVTLSDIYMGILESETVARALVQRFDLQEVYGQATLARTLGELGSHTRIAAELSGVILIRVEDKDPARAADLANAYIEELDRLYRATRSNAARRQREFLEVRVAGSLAAIDSLSSVLATMQAEYRVTALTGDLSEAATAAGDLLGTRMALSIRLQMLEEVGVGAFPYRRELESQLAAVEAEIARLPELGLDVARLLRDLRIQEVLHLAMAEQLEVARLEEVRNITSVEVLDHAVAPDRHSRPRRGLITVAGALLGLAMGFLVTLYRERKSLPAAPIDLGDRRSTGPA